MRILRTLLIVLVTLAALAAAGLFFIGYNKPKQGGIRIDTTPVSSVYINKVFVGKTPFKKTIDPGQISLRIEPDATSSAELVPYETKINIVPGIETVIRREFGTSEELSSGDVITFEKQTGKNASLIVISSPDNAQVSVDGSPRGFSPYKTSTISPAAHKITIRAPGYLERTLSLNTLAGFQLTIYAKLAKSQSPEIEELSNATPKPAPRTYVEILNTPTGFLRVRTEPGSGGEEIAEVKPGEKYPFLDEDVGTGWYKIQYQGPKPGLPGGITGWVSNQYAKKIEVVGEQTATPSATPKI